MLAYDPATLSTRTDTNRQSTANYDPVTTRLRGQRDGFGRWVSHQYDLLGRVTTSVQNCTGSQAPQSCGTATLDQNIANQTHYDALGRTFETVNPLGIVTHTAFDGLGRTTATTQNYVLSDPTTAITNVTTLSTYDALGRVVTMTDALSNTSTQATMGSARPRA